MDKKQMKKLLYILIVMVLLPGCSGGEKSDEFLLEKDRIALVNSLDTYKVKLYKFFKILVRASAEDKETTDSEEFKDAMVRLQKAMKHIERLEKGESLAFVEYISIYNDYKKIEKYISNADEDNFPTLTEVYLNKKLNSQTTTGRYFSGEGKIQVEAYEHAVLGVGVLFARDLGKEISLYESSKTDMNYISDPQASLLIKYVRGLVYYANDLKYLAESEFSDNIELLNGNKNLDLEYVRLAFGWSNLDNSQTHTGYHGISHALRGAIRLSMDRKIDEERAIEDFEAFLKDAAALGLDNELVWTIETYVYLKNEESEKAIASLRKLRTSALLTEDDKLKIDKSIKYLENRDTDSVLSGVYDKFFLSKIALAYTYEVLSKVDWQKILKEQFDVDISGISRYIKITENLSANINKHVTGESLEDVGNEIKEKGKNLFDKAKKFLDSE